MPTTTKSRVTATLGPEVFTTTIVAGDQALTANEPITDRCPVHRSLSDEFIITSALT